MKRVLCFLLVLIVLGTSLVAVTAYSLIKESDNVTFRLIDEWGDRTYLSGITAESGYSADYNRLNWDVEFTPYDNDVKTEMSFRKTGQDGDSYTFYGIGTPSFDLFDLKNQNEKLYEAIESLKKEASNPGDIRTLKVKMSDYFKYYPINLDLTLPGMSISWNSGMGFYDEGEYSYSGITPSRGEGFLKALNDYLKVPAFEEDVREVRIHAGEGGSYSWHTTHKNSFNFEFFDSVFPDTIYFTFCNEISTGHEEKRVLCDTSHIPGGYGIYALPYGEGEINYEELKTVYSVSADSTIEGLYRDEEKNELYLTLHENGRYVLYVIDRATMTDISVIDLFGFTYEDWARVYQYDDFFVFIKNDTEFTIVKREADDTYTSAFSGVIPSETVKTRDYFSYYSTFAFDGERLVVFVLEDPYAEETCVMSIQPDIMVFTEEGIEYYGKWLCSLGSPITPKYYYYFVTRKTGFSVKIK